MDTIIKDYRLGILNDVDMFNLSLRLNNFSLLEYVREKKYDLWSRAVFKICSVESIKLFLKTFESRILKTNELNIYLEREDIDGAFVKYLLEHGWFSNIGFREYSRQNKFYECGEFYLKHITNVYPRNIVDLIRNNHPAELIEKTLDKALFTKVAIERSLIADKYEFLKFHPKITLVDNFSELKESEGDFMDRLINYSINKEKEVVSLSFDTSNNGSSAEVALCLPKYINEKNEFLVKEFLNGEFEDIQVEPELVKESATP